MTPPIVRRTGLLDRTVHNRDARLFLIASEDTYAVEQYFDALQRNGVVDSRRIRIKALPNEPGGGSDPASVLQRLDIVTRDLDELRPLDERWLCLDVDHWATGKHAKNLARVCQDAEKAGIGLAVSNPSFELWLLLHFTDEPKETSAACEQAIRSLEGSYNKTNLVAERYTAQRVDAAMQRAKALDTDESQRWPQTTGTRVYRLVERLPRLRP